MTVGEKILFYRKKIGLSQDELGQKLLVSRQTVSLWEMDKTLPTVDNLRRLREIFSVSIDDLLGEEEPREEECPREVYLFRYSREVWQAMMKSVRVPLLKRMIIFFVACGLLLLLSAAADTSEGIIGWLLGFLVMGAAIHIANLYSHYKGWKLAESQVFESEYRYEIYDAHFLIKISKNGEVVKTFKFFPRDIERVQFLGDHLVLRIGGQIYAISKDGLPEDSFFYSFCGQNPKKVEAQRRFDILKAVSAVLAIGSFLALWGSLWGVSALMRRNGLFVDNMWVFFVFSVIPVASVVFAFILRKKGRPYKLNLVVGIIMTVLLCLYGSFCLIFSDSPTDGAEHLDAQVTSFCRQDV